MELRHLRYFVAVAEELHFGRAASRLGIAQPPLSQQILRLEAQLGTPLLSRTKRKVELTDSGRIFLDEARATLAQADRAVHMAQRASRGEVGQLSVGFVLWADYTSLPRIVRRFGERNPDVELELHSLSSTEQAAALRGGRIQLAITRPPVSRGDGLASEAFLSEPLVACFRRGHRFSAYDEVPWRELAHEPYIALSRERSPRYDAIIAQACREAGITLRVRHEADHPQTILALVEAGIGVSLVPASITKVRRPGISHRSMRPAGPPLRTIVAWPRSQESALVQSFLSVVREFRENA